MSDIPTILDYLVKHHLPSVGHARFVALTKVPHGCVDKVEQQAVCRGSLGSQEPVQVCFPSWIPRFNINKSLVVISGQVADGTNGHANG